MCHYVLYLDAEDYLSSNNYSIRLRLKNATQKQPSSSLKFNLFLQTFCPIQRLQDNTVPLTGATRNKSIIPDWTFCHKLLG